MTAALRRWFGRWGTTPDDLARVMTGDQFIVNPTHSATHAITVHAPPADISTTWQSIGVVFGPSNSLPARGTKPRGDTRNQRRLSDPFIWKLYETPRNFISPVDYRSLTRCGISTSLKLRDNPRAKFHRGTFPGHGLRQKIRPESIAFRGIAPPFVRSGPFISSVRSEQHRMIELIQVIRHAEARPRLMAFT